MQSTYFVTLPETHEKLMKTENCIINIQWKLHVFKVIFLRDTPKQGE